MFTESGCKLINVWSLYNSNSDICQINYLIDLIVCQIISFWVRMLCVLLSIILIRKTSYRNRDRYIIASFMSGHRQLFYTIWNHITKYGIIKYRKKDSWGFVFCLLWVISWFRDALVFNLNFLLSYFSH